MAPFPVISGVAMFLSCALFSCGGGGGGGSSSAPLTEEEQAAAKVEEELSPEDHDVPAEVVPESFQGERLYEVRLELKGKAYADFSAPVMSFCLLPGGQVAEGSLQMDDESASIASASWEGQSAGDGTEAISTLSIVGTCEDGRAMQLYMNHIAIASKTVNGQQTTYTGTVLGGQCSLGGALWLNFLSGTVKCTMTYYIDSSSTR